MTDFAFLLEDGTGKWLLEDGTGVLLLEDQSGPHEGIEIEATHATTALIQKKKPKLIGTELTIKLMSDLITSITVSIPTIKLLPLGIFSESLRRAFVIPTGHIKEKITKYVETQEKEMKMDIFIEELGELGVLKLLMEKIKKWKK